MGLDVSVSAVIGYKLKIRDIYDNNFIEDQSKDYALFVQNNEYETFLADFIDHTSLIYLNIVASMEDGFDDFEDHLILYYERNHKGMESRGILVGSMKVDFYTEKQIDKIKEKIKGILLPIGIWNEENFGLWVASNASW